MSECNAERQSLSELKQRQLVEAIAHADSEMLDARMMIPLIEYVSPSPTDVHAAPSHASIIIAARPAHEVIIALEERTDAAGKLWVQCRSVPGSAGSDLGWVEVQPLWGDTPADAMQAHPKPERIGSALDRDDELPAAPPNQTLGHPFTNNPQLLFITQVYDKTGFGDMHWRSAFKGAKIKGTTICAPTQFFAVRHYHSVHSVTHS